tara:strand:- start:513 stop:815 length:303 start_codon:yes stop_codon:yes gene_type:complete
MAGKAGGSVSGVSGNQGNKNSGGGNPADRTKGKNAVDRSKKGMQKAGGPGATSGKKTSSPRIMRESTWNNMSAGQQRQGYGTTSYATYKAGNTRSSGGRH